MSRGLSSDGGKPLEQIWSPLVSEEEMYILFILSTSLISENDTAGDPFVVIVRAGDERMWGGDPCGRPGVRLQEPGSTDITDLIAVGTLAVALGFACSF